MSTMNTRYFLSLFSNVKTKSPKVKYETSTYHVARFLGRIQTACHALARTFVSKTKYSFPNKKTLFARCGDSEILLRNGHGSRYLDPEDAMSACCYCGSIVFCSNTEISSGRDTECAVCRRQYKYPISQPPRFPSFLRHHNKLSFPNKKVVAEYSGGPEFFPQSLHHSRKEKLISLCSAQRRGPQPVMILPYTCYLAISA